MAAVPIAIVGAGVAGASLALLLARRGIASVIFERDTVSSGGYALQLSANAIHVLRLVGVYDQVEKIARPAMHLDIRSGRGDQLLSRKSLVAQKSLVARASHAGAKTDDYWLLSRSDLISRLYEAMDNSEFVEFRRATSVQEVRQVNERIELFLDDGKKLDVSSVAIAAGTRGYYASMTRDTDAIRIKFDGDVAYSDRLLARGTLAPNRIRSGTSVSSTPILDTPTSSTPTSSTSTSVTLMSEAQQSVADINLWLGENSHFVSYPLADDSVNMVLDLPLGSVCAHDLHRGWAHGSDLASIASWCPEVVEQLTRCQNMTLWRAPKTVKSIRASSSRIVFLGDSMHPLAPYLAQGAAMALEDAACLANLVDDSSRLFDGDNFSLERAKRLKRIGKTVRTLALIYHQPAVLNHLRDCAIKVASAVQLEPDFDWIYSYRE